VTALRRRLGLTLDGLARKLGTSRPTVARIERGDALLRAALLSRLATLGGRPAEWLLSGPPRGEVAAVEPDLPPALSRRLPTQRGDAQLGPYVALGRRLLEQRRRVGLTQGMLADRAGVTRQTLGRLERGAGVPNAPQLVRISRALGVTLDALLRLDDRTDSAGEGAVKAPPDRTDPRCCARCGQEKPATGPGPRLPRHRRYDLRTGPFIAVGSRIVMARHRLRWSRDELARQSGLGRMTVARIEAGTVCPRGSTLQRIAAVVGVAAGWLLTGQNGANAPSGVTP
jgi:transcriptional regulator with XRE-family HTH domain